MTLDKDRVFIQEHLQQLLGETTKLMELAIGASGQLDSESRKLQGHMDEIPSNVIDYELLNDLSGAKFEKDEFHETLSRLRNFLTRLIENIPRIDQTTSSVTQELNDITNQLAMTAKGYRDLIGSGLASGAGLDGLLTNIDRFRMSNGLKGDAVATRLDNVMAGLKGLQAITVLFSRDPVNLATGNFVYEKEDMSIKGAFPLAFKRSYNSIDDRKGVLGADWIHNYEVALQQHENIVKITFEDGHVAVFQAQNDGGFRSEKQAFDTLIKKDEDYLLSKASLEKYLFNKDGQLIEKADVNGNKVVFTYKNKQLHQVENTSGSLKFSYGKDGKLLEVRDHSYRKITLSYENGRLTKVTNDLGNAINYQYDHFGKLKQVINPRKIIGVENHFDSKDRTTKQVFPDGGEMTYEYDDKKRQIHLTEQNGNKITYVRDEKYRNTETIYCDGKEISEFNEQNKRTSFTDKNGHTTRYEYDAKGNVTKTTDALGYVTKIQYDQNNKPTKFIKSDASEIVNTYDERGNLKESVNPLGHKTKLEYNKSGQPTTITQPDGSTISLQYDGKGNIVEIIDAFGSVTSYQYDKLNRVIKTTNGNGFETVYRYNEENRIVAVTNAEGNTRRYRYNESGKVIRMNDFDEHSILIEYNQLGKVAKLIDRAGGETAFEYDLMWNISKVTDQKGAETVYLYNELNRLKTIRNANGHELNYGYDPNGNLTKVVTPSLDETAYKYDALNRRQTVIEANGAVTNFQYDAMGNLVEVIDAMNHKTCFSYDAAGKLIGKMDTLGNQTKLCYNELGKINKITDANGNVTEYNYYSGGRLKEKILPAGESEKYSYDQNGNLKKRTNKLGETIKYSYDCLDHLTKITNPIGSTREFHYDAVGNVTMAQDENGNITKYRYSPLGHLIEVVDAMGCKTGYDYDATGKLTRIEQFGMIDDALSQAEKHNLNNRVTVYERNLLGQVTKMIDPLGNSESYHYDSNGHMSKKTDKDGFETRVTFNEVGKVESIHYADEKTVAMSYNPLKQLTEMTDWLGTTKMALDAKGKPLAITDHNGNTIQYEWGSMGERKKIIYPDDRTVHYAYNESMRLAEMTDLNENKIHYQYDEMGRLIEKSLPNGLQSSYQYNELGQITSLLHHNASEVLDHYQYSYDAAGNKISIEKEQAGTPEDTGLFVYGYDASNRLTTVLKDAEVLRDYQYDAYGNRAMMAQSGINTSYQYNELNQLILMKSDVEKEEQYSYDKRGNLTEVWKNGTLANQYFFGALNRLEGAMDHESELGATYQYNGMMNRVGKIEGNPTEPVMPTTGLDQFSLNPIKQIDDVLDLTKRYHNLLQRQENQEIVSYSWDNKVVSSTRTDDMKQYYLLDELGSPIRLLDANSAGQEVHGYDEFGNDLYNSDAATQPFTYTGYQQDTIANTYFAQAREYRPDQGRFTSEDIVKGFASYPMTLNPYSYCWNQPMNLVDRDGAWPSWDGIGDLCSDVVDTAGDVVADVGDVVTAGWDGLVNTAEATVEGIGNITSAGIDTVSNIASTSWDATTDIVSSVVHGDDIISTAWDGVTSVASATASGVFDIGSATIEANINTVEEMLTGGINVAAESFEGCLDAVINSANLIIENQEVISSIGDSLGRISDVIGIVAKRTGGTLILTGFGAEIGIPLAAIGVAMSNVSRIIGVTDLFLNFVPVEPIDCQLCD